VMCEPEHRPFPGHTPTTTPLRALLAFASCHSTGLHFVTGISNRSFADNAVFISTLTI
jgi:hypothetical protein